jgi:hypothetical protein
MALSPASRYRQMTDIYGRAVTKRKARPSNRYSTTVTIQGQTFQEIAAKWLGDPKLYWMVADLNPHVPYPEEIPMGTRIRIPSG